jgi:hypothetical protein
VPKVTSYISKEVAEELELEGADLLFAEALARYFIRLGRSIHTSVTAALNEIEQDAAIAEIDETWKNVAIETLRVARDHG